MSDVDASLWRAWRDRKDAGAFERLVRPHLEFATAFARRLGLGLDDADEVVQRSLVRLASESREKPVRVGVRAWLGRDVLTETRMLVRARSRRERHEAMAPPREEGGTEAVDARDAVEAALRDLDEDARRAVELRFLHDLEYREVAFVLGRSPLACRLLVHRAIARLRKRFGRSAPLLVAALPRGADAAAVARIADVVPAAAEAAAASGIGASVAGGLAMATAWKVGGMAAGIALLAWLGWSALGPGPAPEDATAHEAGGMAAPPGLATAPPPLATGTSGSMAGDSATGSVPAAKPDPDATPRVPLDAPIPPGTGSVAGTIRFTDGKPFAHARVGLWGSPQIVAETDEEGRYHIHGDWVADRVLTLLGPHGEAMDLGALASMKPDARIGLDASIEPGITLVVRVADATTHASLVGRMVSMRRPGANANNVMQAGFGFATTDSDGRVRFEHVPPVPVQLSVSAPAYELNEREIDLRSEPSTVDLLLRKARPLPLRVRGLPVGFADWRVHWVFTHYHPLAGFVEGDAIVAANGEATLDAPPVGRWRLSIKGSGLPGFETDVHVTTADVPVVEWTVPSRAAVAGRILDAEGQPMANARLLLSGADSVRADGEGRFRIPSIPVGSATAYLLFGDYDSVRAGSVEVPPSGRDDLEVRAAGTASIAARVPKASVVSLWELAPFGHVATAYPRGDGSIRIPWLPAGSFRLTVVPTDDTEMDSRDVHLSPGQTLDLGAIRLAKYPVIPVALSLPPTARRPATLNVTFVRDVGGTRAGKPIGQGRVEFDGEGRGWLKGLPAGEFVVRVEAPGFAPTEMTIEIRDGVTTPIRIDLRLP